MVDYQAYRKSFLVAIKSLRLVFRGGRTFQNLVRLSRSLFVIQVTLKSFKATRSAAHGLLSVSFVPE